jgi:hypothetical protein
MEKNQKITDLSAWRSADYPWDNRFHPQNELMAFATL